MLAQQACGATEVGRQAGEQAGSPGDPGGPGQGKLRGAAGQVQGPTSCARGRPHPAGALFDRLVHCHKKLRNELQAGILLAMLWASHGQGFAVVMAMLQYVLDMWSSGACPEHQGR